MVTIIRDDQIDKELDRRRIREKPVKSRAAIAAEGLREWLGLKPKRERKGPKS